MLVFFNCTTTFAIDMLLKSHGFSISGRHCSSAGADRKWAKHDVTPLTLFFQNPWYQKHIFVNFFYPFSSHPITGSSQCLSFQFSLTFTKYQSSFSHGKTTSFFDHLKIVRCMARFPSGDCSEYCPLWWLGWKRVGSSNLAGEEGSRFDWWQTGVLDVKCMSWTSR